MAFDVSKMNHRPRIKTQAAAAILIGLAALAIRLAMAKPAERTALGNNYNVQLRASDMEGTRLKCLVMATEVFTNTAMKPIEQLALAHESYGLVHHWVDNQPRKIAVYVDGFQSKYYTIMGSTDLTAVLHQEED